MRKSTKRRLIYSYVSLLPSILPSLAIYGYAWVMTGNPAWQVLGIFRELHFQIQLFLSSLIFISWQFGRVALRRLNKARTEKRT